MKPTTVPANAERPNRVLVALAAAWMIASLAFGGVVSGQAPAEAAGPAQVAADEAALP